VFHLSLFSHAANLCSVVNYQMATSNWAIPCQFSGSGLVTLSNFLEILLKLSLPHMMNICKI